MPAYDDIYPSIEVWPLGALTESLNIEKQRLQMALAAKSSEVNRGDPSPIMIILKSRMFALIIHSQFLPFPDNEAFATGPKNDRMVCVHTSKTKGKNPRPDHTTG